LKEQQGHGECSERRFSAQNVAAHNSTRNSICSQLSQIGFNPIIAWISVVGRVGPVLHTKHNVPSLGNPKVTPQQRCCSSQA